MDDPRFRSRPAQRNETNPVAAFASSPRSAVHYYQPSPHDARSSMLRRFTTDSGRVPTLSLMTSVLAPPQRMPGVDGAQNFQKTMHKVQLIEQKIEYERLREQKRCFEFEMQKLDQKQKREAQELAQMQEEIGRLEGHQSEPTTPPDYRDSAGFPSMFSRPNPYSTLASPPGFANRPARSGSQLTSPSSAVHQHHFSYGDGMPSRSVPTTRRNSDEGEQQVPGRHDPVDQRPANSQNRYSMPVPRSRTGLNEMNLDQTNTTRFLFGDEEPKPFSPLNTSDETFPTLVRREDQMLSASSAALDLALAPSPNPEASTGKGWSYMNRHRPQQSLSFVPGAPSLQKGDFPSASGPSTISRPPLNLKHMSDSATTSADLGLPSHGNASMPISPPKLQSSFSANDVPTVKGSAVPSQVGLNANNHAQQHFHNHNASIGRIPAGAMPTRGHERELSFESNNHAASRDPGGAFPSIQSALQANAAPFGPSLQNHAAIGSGGGANFSSPGSPASLNQYAPFYPTNGYGAADANMTGNYALPMLSANMQQMSLGNANGSSAYNNSHGYPGYGQVPYAPTHPRDSQARVIQNRRQMDNEVMSRYQNMPLETFRGQIYDLCKDQHGCRYLQKNLEEQSPDQINIVWRETNQHVTELMMDPFGNYLCQKLLEYCDDDERTVLIQNCAPDILRIALNQHGTRALQKMIEFVSTPQQTRLIIEALRDRVVQLIQDLNGNHVIQKCLNKLGPYDAQFIFDAVGKHCVDVGTHRHGCCVLQRCIDHASGHQKAWLVEQITLHARSLVRDPFGNYVVQYIIDLNEPTFTDPVVQSFKGCIGDLSCHKFSSNVIEKCLRCAGPESKDMILDEVLVPQEIHRQLRDSFGNYVIQTALEFATPHQKHRLVEAIRTLLPQIRTTPYGRRIQAKIALYDSRGLAASSGQATLADSTQGQIPIRPSHGRGASGHSASSRSIDGNGSAGGGRRANHELRLLHAAPTS